MILYNQKFKPHLNLYFYNILIYFIIKYIYMYMPFYIIYNNYKIYNHNILYKFKKYTYKNKILKNIDNISCYLKLKYTNNTFNNTFLLNYNINSFFFKLPILKKFNIFYINNLKKIYINRLSNKNSIYYNTYTLNKFKIYSSTIFISKLNNYRIYINTNNIVFIKYKYFTIPIFLLFYIIGLSNKYIYYYCIKNISNIIIKKNIQYTLHYIYNYKFIKFLVNFNKFYFFIIKKHIFYILNTILILFKIKQKKYNLNDIDHFNNKYIETFNDFIKETLYLSLDRFFKITNYNIYKLKNLKYISNIIQYNIKESLNINPLCHTILTSLNVNKPILKTYKQNKLTLIGPGSILHNDNMYNINLKNIHFSQIGNICFIDTSENLKSGLILSKSYNTKNINNVLHTKLLKINYKNKNTITYLKSNLFEKIKIIFNFYYIKKKKIFILNKYITTYKNEFTVSYFKNKVFPVYYYLHPTSVFSFLILNIPFINYTDPIRLLMGTKMISQSLNCLFNEKAFVSNYINNISYNQIKTISEGLVLKINNNCVYFKTIFKKIIKYNIPSLKFKIKVWEGERLLFNDIIAYTNENKHNCITYGKNLLVSYNYFNGYEFEDAIIVNKTLKLKYIYTNINFNIYLINLHKSINSIEYITYNIPNTSYINKKYINKYGLIKKNIILNKNTNNLLIGKVTLKTNDIKLYIKNKNLIYNLFSLYYNNIINKTLYIYNINEYTKILKLIFYTNNKISYYLNIKILTATILKLNIGDKLSGRYGNKGVISLIINSIEMPYNSLNNILPDILLNPLSVPSRMNLGQLYEGLFGIIGYYINIFFKYNIDINFYNKNIKIILYQYIKQIKYIYNYNTLNLQIKNSKNGFKLNFSCILNEYILKLTHIVTDKINFRHPNTNFYNSLSQQPIKGKKNKGGQRFGEMELWALNAYKSIYNLYDMLYIKSDTLKYRDIFKLNLNSFSFSESFISLIKDLYSLQIKLHPSKFFYNKIFKYNYINN